MSQRRIIQRIAMLVSATGLAASCQALAQPQPEPIIRHDESGKRAVSITHLVDPENCAPSEDIGRVSKRHMEKGRLKAITFKDARSETYINMPHAADFKDGRTFRRVSEALAQILASGAELRVNSVACGAAGRIVYLEAIALATAPAATAAPATAPATPAASAGTTPVPAPKTQWVIAPANRHQLHIEIKSTDGAFEWSISCSKQSNGTVDIGSNWFTGPRGWTADWEKPRLAIDGSSMAWEIDGADQGIVISDSTSSNNVASLSKAALARLASGQRFSVGGKTNRNRPRDAIFDISGGAATFAEFEVRCRKLPPS